LCSTFKRNSEDGIRRTTHFWAACLICDINWLAALANMDTNTIALATAERREARGELTMAIKSCCMMTETDLQVRRVVARGFAVGAVDGDENTKDNGNSVVGLESDIGSLYDTLSWV